jgi:hypothetical protein
MFGLTREYKERAMWLAVTFAAIALTGTEFMIWFLFALFREHGVLNHPRKSGSVKLSENEVHAKTFATGLIRVDVHTVTGGDCQRAVHSRQIGHFSKSRLWLN